MTTRGKSINQKFHAIPWSSLINILSNRIWGISFLWFSPLSFNNAVHLSPHPTLPPLPCSYFPVALALSKACTNICLSLLISRTPSLLAFSPLQLKSKSFAHLYKTGSSCLLVMSSVSVESRNLEYTHTHTHTHMHAVQTVHAHSPCLKQASFPPSPFLNTFCHCIQPALPEEEPLKRNGEG